MVMDRVVDFYKEACGLGLKEVFIMVIDRVVDFYKEACGFGFPLYNTPPKWLGEFLPLHHPGPSLIEPARMLLPSFEADIG